MKLYAKCLPVYFEMLDLKQSEFRQFESIVIEDSVSGKKREFEVKDVRRIDDQSRSQVETMFPMVDWDPERPIYSIDLGDELNRNDILSATQPAFEIPDSEKTWHGVGD